MRLLPLEQRIILVINCSNYVMPFIEVKDLITRCVYIRTVVVTCISSYPQRGYTPGVKRSWDEPEENLVAPSIRSL